MSGGGVNPHLGNPLDYYSEGFTGYSPANFQDAEDTRPNEIALDPTGSGLTAPYSTLVGNVVMRHVAEIKENHQPKVQVPNGWKRKIREFMGQKNEDLIRFIKKPLAQHPTLGQADGFMKRFGRTDFQIPQNSLQTSIFDISGKDTWGIFEEDVKRMGPSSPSQIVEQIRWIYEKYKTTSEDLLQAESQLKIKLDMLDKCYQKLITVMDLPENEATKKVGDSIYEYMNTLLEDYEIESAYTKYVSAYRQFISIREMVSFLRCMETHDKDPLCSICLQETVTHTLSPCGHTFCMNCSKRQMTSCYICRTQIRERIKIFFG